MRILLIEDTADLAEAIQAWLNRAGHDVAAAATAAEGLALLARWPTDLLLLDINLPDRSGMSVLSDLRAAGNRLPVVVITARSDIDDKVSLLESGADDHLVKPFDLRELEARLRAVMRRPERRPDATPARGPALDPVAAPVPAPAPSPRTLAEPVAPQLGTATPSIPKPPAASHVCGRLCLDPERREALVDGRPLPLLRRELRLLEILLQRQGRLMTREQLISQLFEWDAVAPNALEVHISRLRRKISGAGVEILTLRGEGYRLQAAA